MACMSRRVTGFVLTVCTLLVGCQSGTPAPFVDLVPTGSLTVNGGIGSGVYPLNSTVPIAVTIPHGYRFDIWTSDTATIADPHAETTTVLITADAVVTATFVQRFHLTVSVQGGGSVEFNPTGNELDMGTVVSVQARPNSDWVFTRWSGDLTTTNAQEFVYMDRDLTITAVFDPAPPNLVLLGGASVGGGSVYVDPVGQSNGLGGFLYPAGTFVVLTAVAAPGWHFDHFGGDVSSTAGVIQIALNTDTFVIGQFVEDVAPPPPAYIGAILVAQDGQYLGQINTNPFADESLANPFGTYGNSYGSYSIWNSYGLYGSTYATYSPYNSFSFSPPLIILDNAFYAYLTKNPYQTPRIDPDNLARLLGRPEVARD